MNSEIEINLSVLLEPRDYLRANFWFLFKNPLMKLLPIFATLLLVLSIYTWIQRPEQVPWHGFVLPGIVIFSCLYTYMASNRSFANNKALQQTINYRFSSEGIDVSAAQSHGHMNWQGIVNAYETKHNFLLFISKNQMYTIPRRCLDAEQINSFRSLLKDHLSSRAMLRRS